MKKLILIAALAATFAALAADTDCGALITTGNIADSAKVENLTGANAGKATITINNNSGTAQSVTVYNAATVDTALSGKASTGDVTTLQNRATALETATNNLSSAVATAQAAAESAASAAANAYANSTNYTASGYLPKTAGTQKRLEMGYGHVIDFSGDTSKVSIRLNGNNSETTYKSDGTIVKTKIAPSTATSYTFEIPDASGTAALRSDITNDVPAWARATNKPSYNFSEIGSKPTTIAGYGITDAKISNGTITLGSDTITPLTSFTEEDPAWASEKSSYSTTSQMNTAIAGATNALATVAQTGAYSDLSGTPTSLKNPNALSIVGTSTTSYDGSATASVNQTTQTQTSTTQNGTTGKNLTIQVAATSLDMGAYYIKIGTDGKPHLMLRQ